MLRGLRLLLNRYRRDERGSSTIESIFVMGVFTTIFAWTMETGFVMFRWVNLERAVDEVAREVRLFGLADKYTDPDHPDYVAGAGHEFIKTEICDASVGLRDCQNSLLVELAAIDVDDGTPNLPSTCRDRTVPFDPATTPLLNTGDRGNANTEFIVYLRVCMVMDTLFAPGYSLPFERDDSGGISIKVDSAFVNEPTNNSTSGIGS
ncbi:MAG: TadE family protein [Pseudomonadota bacterium]